MCFSTQESRKTGAFHSNENSCCSMGVAKERGEISGRVAHVPRATNLQTSSFQEAVGITVFRLSHFQQTAMSARGLVRTIRKAVSTSSTPQIHSTNSKRRLSRWGPFNVQLKHDTSFRELLNPDIAFVRDQSLPLASFLPSSPGHHRDYISGPSHRLYSTASGTISLRTPTEENKASSASTSAVDSDDVRSVAPSRTASDGTAPRFYRRASAAPAADGNGWVVKLDHRVLKTPAKKPMKLPTEALALAIAAEWEWQVSLRPKFRSRRGWRSVFSLSNRMTGTIIVISIVVVSMF